jgi:hypothetical protein
MENKIYGPFFSEEPVVIGDMCLAMMENTALHHVPVGTVFQVHHLTSAIVFMPFWLGSFLVIE